ncbi:MAG TPA: D-alanyl-D-alanine carboxypeptidase/D-alanyl-D-alanine-endopeptidase [Polyangia bacterium]|nr:D-alanyl-D-alanine carboxypeptidase/D-alanyl-D-alanine-endopeptidase [Polyangia bacterium]
MRRALLVAALLAVVFIDRRAGAARGPAVVKKARGTEVAPEPPAGDRDHDRIVRMQVALREILHESILRRTRVGMRVIEASTGRVFFESRGQVLMDPASNQKVLATTTALMRLGADWRFRTELTGPEPGPDGAIVGDVTLRGSGDPTVTAADLDAMASALVRRGVRSIAGAVIADPRRLGADEPVDDEGGQDGTETADDATAAAPLSKLSPRVPLVVNHGLISIQVRPGAEAGARAEVTTLPADPSFVIHDSVRTKARGRARVSVRLSVAGGRIQVDLDGRVTLGRPGLVLRRRVPQQAIYAAALMRAALAAAGITVRDDARVGPAPEPRPGRPTPLLALHESAPLAVLLRKINKDSENDYAERVLESAGAEVYGGPATGDKGVRLLREVIGELGLSPSSYVPKNGSGLGHANRITADAMSALLRALYLDPRVGPELLQSLSVGGVDGTTRNRFKGTLAAERVRAKTGTLAGKSCLSGLVGDGPDVLAFSILVEGLHGHGGLRAVRGAQVTCVNAMMRYVREARGAIPAALSQATPAENVPVDIEQAQDVNEGDEELATTPAAVPVRSVPKPAAPAGPRFLVPAAPH